MAASRPDPSGVLRRRGFLAGAQPSRSHIAAFARASRLDPRLRHGHGR